MYATHATHHTLAKCLMSSLISVARLCFKCVQSTNNTAFFCKPKMFAIFSDKMRNVYLKSYAHKCARHTEPTNDDAWQNAYSHFGDDAAYKCAAHVIRARMLCILLSCYKHRHYVFVFVCVRAVRAASLCSFGR